MADRDHERLIDAWLDGEATDEEAERVEHWLNEDADLRSTYGPLLAELRRPDTPDLPAGLRDRVVQAGWVRIERGQERLRLVGRGPRHPAGWRRWSVPVGIAAAVALFAAGWQVSRLWPPSVGPGSHPMIANASDQPTLVLTPWMASGYAQGLAVGTPISPASYVLQGAAMELLQAVPAESGSPTPVLRLVPVPVPPQPDPQATPVPVLMPLQRM